MQEIHADPEKTGVSATSTINPARHRGVIIFSGLRNYNAVSFASVWDGKKLYTKGGLMKADLMVSKSRGSQKIVSKKRSTAATKNGPGRKVLQCPVLQWGFS